MLQKGSQLWKDDIIKTIVIDAHFMQPTAHIKNSLLSLTNGT